MSDDEGAVEMEMEEVPADVTAAIRRLTDYFKEVAGMDPHVLVVGTDGLHMVSEAGLKSLLDEVYERGMSVAGGVALEKGFPEVAEAISAFKLCWKQEEPREDKQLPLVVM